MKISDFLNSFNLYIFLMIFWRIRIDSEFFKS